LLMGLANVGLALPSIVLAPLAVLVFAVWLRWLPAGGIGSPAHLVLPAVALALPFAAAIARLTRGGIADTLTEPHVRTARAKGLSPARILAWHVLPLALQPVLSFLGPAAATLLTGSVVIEQVFDLPGIGRYFVQAALNRDYTLVMGVVVVYAVLILLFNLLVDLVYATLDPRIRPAPAGAAGCIRGGSRSGARSSPASARCCSRRWCCSRCSRRWCLRGRPGKSTGTRWKRRRARVTGSVRT